MTFTGCDNAEFRRSDREIPINRDYSGTCHLTGATPATARDLQRPLPDDPE
jgi:hypothetical protein